MRIVPAVGSIRRMRVRTSVDLPEPESPITTKTSPGQTSKETSRTAATHPVCSRSAARLNSASDVPMMRSAFGPKIFQIPDAAMRGSPTRPLPVTRADISTRGARVHTPLDRRPTSAGYSRLPVGEEEGVRWRSRS
jgi:hypothetical protein